MSLKHRNTSKWAKHLITKAGKNADVSFLSRFINVSMVNLHTFQFFIFKQTL